MTVLDNRKEALENKFMRDEELRFKATAFAVKKLAQEVGEKAGLSTDATQAFVTDVITNILVVEGLKDSLTYIYKQAFANKVNMALPEVEVAFDHYFQSRMTELMGQKK